MAVELMSAIVEAARQLVQSLVGVDVSPYKDSVFFRRLRARARERGFRLLDDYLDDLATGGPAAEAEARRLVSGLRVSVSGFFRDSKVFETIENVLCPELLHHRGPREAVCAWSAACSKGQEAYSLAISLWRCARRVRSAGRITVLGTDVDENALAAARSGVYPARALEAVPEPARSEIFVPEAQGRWAVREEIRALVRFLQGDLLDFDSHPVGMDIIACRNLLIYLRRPVQEELVLALHRALRPGGFLVLGSSETILGRPWDAFEHVDPSQRIYRKPSTPSN